MIDVLNVIWYAWPNDLIGGWSIMSEDKPPSTGAWEIASFVREEECRHIVRLHNSWLRNMELEDEALDQ
jgi:hypothetical protein